MSKTEQRKASGDKRWTTRVGEQLDDFFGIDLRTLAVVRIVGALTVLWTLAILYQDLSAFFTDNGVYPRSYWMETRRNPYIVSLHVIRGELWWQQFLFGLHGIFGLMLLVGYKTRFASIMTWLLLVSLMARTPPLVHRGDTLLCLLMLWGALTPWGARFSIDGALNTIKEMPERVTSMATAGLLLQMPMLYVVSVFLKGPDRSWHADFTAVFYSASPEYVTPIGQFIAEKLPFWFSQGLTIFTLVAEGPLAFLMFFPLLIFASREVRQRWLERFRLIGLVGLSALQAGLLAMTAIGLFPMISTLGLLPLIATRWWNRWGESERVKEARELTIFYDPDCGFCKKMVLILRQFLLPMGTKVVAASEEPELHELMLKENSWIIRDGEGDLQMRYQAFLVMLKHSPWAFWMAVPAGWIKPVGDQVYRLVASNRKFMGRFTRPFDYGAYHPQMGLISAVAATLMMASMITSNIDSATENTFTPREIRQIQRGLRIHQNWRMFVSPIRWSSYYVIHGTLRNGTEVDLFGAGGPIGPESVQELTWAPPEVQRSRYFYSNYRWRLYFQSIRRSNSMEDRRYYGSYVCRAWNAEHRGGQQLDRLRFYRMVQTRDLLHEPFYEEAEKRFLWRHWCFGRPADADDDDD